MTIKELIQSFNGKSKQEIIEILIKEKIKLLGEQQNESNIHRN